MSFQLGENSHEYYGVFILWIGCTTYSVEVGKNMSSVRDLDHGNMKCISQKGSQQFDKAQRDNKLHM
jgi:hypothetical protein